MPRVLVADDAAFARRRYARILRSEGYEVIEAENGADAVRAYSTAKPDAVLLDLNLPELDGLAALHAIRQRDPSAKVILLLALGQESFAQRALQLGASGLVIKPLRPDHVLTAIKECGIS